MALNHCPDVWKNLYIRPLNQQQVHLAFCCQNSTVQTNIAQWQDTIKRKRQNFIDNDWPDQCDNCWKVEKRNGTSKRQQELIWHQSHDSDQNCDDELTVLEWNCDNLCNLACISCGPIFSSRWSTEIKKYSWTDEHQYQSRHDNSFYNHLDLSKLKRVYFNGGEPLMSKDHLQILEKLKNLKILGECEISYNTNGTIIPDQIMIDLWQQARLIRVFVSIDAIEQEFEFIRWPARWQQTLDFIQKLKSLSFNVIIDITCTLGIHNVFSLGKIYNWYSTQCKFNHQGDHVTLNLQSCSPISHGGKVLNLENISARLAKLASQYLNDLDADINLSSFIEQCQTANGNDQEWVLYLENLSSQRKLNWQQSLPELALRYDRLS